ncbi:MAG: type II toxin-antitoxin system PrlF family antitoxin [Paracoccus sp. (in: a-proteobacteria)]|nr:type II toxin-antitoxin system PrlF family antitoxin [Paracoccus sp. (in: a-proteobacteria)]
MSESSITVKGQTTLPKSVRQALDLVPGDRLRYVILDGGQVRIMRTRSVSGLAGMLRRKGHGAVSLEQMDEAVAQGANDRP